MTFREYNLTIMKDAVLGKLLPLECRRTYPWFSLEGSTLCASFAGFRIAPGKHHVKVFPPIYYLKITYPQCAVQSFEKLSGKMDAENGKDMIARDPAEIMRLAELCDEVLLEFDNKSEGLAAVIAEYQALLESILEPEQLTVLKAKASGRGAE